MKKVFDARCLRCDSINAIGIVGRFGEGTDPDDVYSLLSPQHELFCFCPKCNKMTLHKLVTAIYECSSDNDNV